MINKNHTTSEEVILGKKQKILIKFVQLYIVAQFSRKIIFNRKIVFMFSRLL